MTPECSNTSLSTVSSPLPMSSAANLDKEVPKETCPHTKSQKKRGVLRLLRRHRNETSSSNRSRDGHAILTATSSESLAKGTFGFVGKTEIVHVQSPSTSKGAKQLHGSESLDERKALQGQDIVQQPHKPSFGWDGPTPSSLDWWRQPVRADLFSTDVQATKASHKEPCTRPSSNRSSNSSRRRLSDHEKDHADALHVPGKVVETGHDYDSYFGKHPDHVDLLRQGGALFSFTCTEKTQKSLPPYEYDTIDCIANLSSFVNEVEENGVPHVNLKPDHSKNKNKTAATSSGASSSVISALLDQYTIVMTKCVYYLPGNILPDEPSRLADILSSCHYQRHCQPSGTHVWDDATTRQTPQTFRITKPVIPYLYWITIQFKVSHIVDDVVLAKLSTKLLHGMPITCALLLERTKRNIHKQDRTRKAKSLLLYTKVPVSNQTNFSSSSSGPDFVVLVHHFTVILQSSLPKIIERVIGRFGGWGLAEACETVGKTRQYLLQEQDRQQEAQDGDTDTDCW